VKHRVTAFLVLMGFALGRGAIAQSWDIPLGAANEKSPLAATPSLLAKGGSLYRANCSKCHGRDAKGDGPDKTNDLSHRPPDLTDGFRAQFNPDGVMFYKIWNGRQQPTMPALKSKLSKDDVWAIVEYVKALRQPSAQRGSTR
jgi:mono/diheme cytochrome c family protein